MSTAFAAVKRELLVRYLDTWAPAALHGLRKVTYAELSSAWSVADAVRVFAEFPELLAKHGLDVVTSAAVSADLDLPLGLTVKTVTGDPLPALSRDGPLFVHFDMPPRPPTPDELKWLAGGRSTELFLALDAAAAVGRAAVHSAGFAAVAEIELVDGEGTVQRVLFATGLAKHLVAFKEALWAVDEYAGVRYRDPRDSEQTLLDISLKPPVGPLKRALLDRVRRSSSTVAELRDYAVAETVYQAADATRVLTALIASGALARTPDRGRITAETVIRMASAAGVS
jgi:hypothetical protein